MRTLELLEKEVKGELADSLQDHMQRVSLQGSTKTWRNGVLNSGRRSSSLKQNHPAEEDTCKYQELKHCYRVFLSADYQMQKLVPHWDQSPTRVYLLSTKLSFDLVDHREDSAAVYTHMYLMKQWDTRQQIIRYHTFFIIWNLKEEFWVDISTARISQQCWFDE